MTMHRALRVLLVDDAAAVREVVALMLESLGHTVTMADRAAKALDLLGSGLEVDLVLTDYHMPGMDGLALAREIRRRWPPLPVGLITGTLNAADEDARAFTLVLAKPITAADLERALAAFQARRG